MGGPARSIGTRVAAGASVENTSGSAVSVEPVTGITGLPGKLQAESIIDTRVKIEKKYAELFITFSSIKRITR
jgi:hypothetical protein